MGTDPQKPSDLTLVRVLKPFLGTKRDVHRIEVINPKPIMSAVFSAYKGPLYIESSACHPLPGIPEFEPISAAGASSAHGYPWPYDWKELGPIGTGEWCYLEEKQQMYYARLYQPGLRTKPIKLEEGSSWITGASAEIELPLPNPEDGYDGAKYDVPEPDNEKPFKTLKEFVEFADEKAILQRGVTQILHFYGRINAYESPPKDLLDMIVDTEMAYIPSPPHGFYLDPRTGYIDIAVALRASYVNAIPRYLYSDDDLNKYFSNTDGYSYSFAYSTLQAKIDFITKHTTDRATELQPKFPQQAAKLIRVVQYLNSFPARFKRFVLLNEVPEEELTGTDPHFELGFSKDFQISYVLMGKADKRSTPLTIALPMLTSVNQRPGTTAIASHHFLYSFEDMEKKVQDPALTAIEFAQRYYYPVTAIVFKPTEAESEENPRTTTPAIAQAAAVSKHEDPAGVGKSTSQIMREKQSLDNVDHKIQLSKSREKEQEFTGDNIIEDIEFLKAQAKDPEGIYKHVLNKTSIKELSAIALADLTKDFGFADQQKMVLDSVITKATGAQIEKMASIIQEKYPGEYSKALAKELDAAQEYFETTGTPKEGTVPPAIKNSDGSINDVKLARAIETNMALSGWHKNIQSPQQNQGQQISEEMSPDQKKQMRYFSGFEYGSGLKFGEGYSLPTVDGILSDNTTISSPARKADILKRLTNNSGNEFKLPISILEKTILPIVPYADVRSTLSQYMGNVNDVMEEIQEPTSLKELAPPTVTLPDNSFTSDPTPGVVDAVVAGIREAIAKGLIATITMVLDRIKKSAADAFGERFGAMVGKIPLDMIKAAFHNAGVPPGTGAEFFENLAKQATVSEMEDLFAGRTSEETDSLVMVTAGMTPGMFEHLQNISNAFDNLSDLVEPDIFRKARESEAEAEVEDAPWSGLLCEDDDFPDEDNRDRTGLEEAQHERDRDLANRLKDLIDGANNLLSDIPSTMSDCGEQGLISRDPPSMQMANKLALDTIFESVEMAFSQDATGFMDSLLLKKSRDAKKGDPDWIPTYGKELGIDQMTGAKIDPNPTKKMAVAHNKKNSKIEVSVLPSLKKNLSDVHKKNFKLYSEYVGDEEKGEGITWISMSGEVDPKKTKLPITFAAEEAQLAQAKATVKKIQNKMSDLNSSGLGLGADALHHLLNDMEKADNAFTAAKEVLDQAIKAAPSKIKKDKSFDLSNKVEEKLLEFSMTWPESSGPVVDRHSVTLGDGDQKYVLANKTKSPSNNLSETTFYKILPGSTGELGVYRTAQSQAFANYITNRFTNAGYALAGIPEDFEMSTGFQEYALNWEQVFFRLFKKTARQASLSNLFELEELLEVSLSKKYEKTLCAPDPEAFDLLSVSETKEEVEDDYEQSCKPSNKSDAAGSPFEEAALGGVLKVYLRLCVAEVLLRSIFIYSQFNPEEVFEDGLFMDYVVDMLRKDLENSDPDFFSRLKKQAQIIISNKRKSGDLKNIYNINDMTLLDDLDETGYQEERANAAFKYIVLEQAADLSYKLQQALGTQAPKIYKRFLNSTGTPEPFNIVTPQTSLGSGWIRTIDAPKASVVGTGDQRFIARNEDKVKNLGGNQSTGTSQTTWEGEITYDTARLMYPDLAMVGGTFVLEKYVRVEDLDRLPDDFKDPYGFRLRHGGPDAPDEGPGEPDTLASWCKTTPHLSGVVNISAFRQYLDQVFEIHPADAKVSSFFKPLKFGMRLMWIPPTNQNFKAQLYASETSEVVGDIKKEQKHEGKADATFGSLGLSPSQTALYEETFGQGAATHDDVKGTILTGGQTDIEYSIKDTYKDLSAKSPIAKKEKAFCIIEKDLAESKLTLGGKIQASPDAKVEQYDYKQEHTRGYSKELYPIPLVSVERPLSATTMKEARKAYYDEEYFRGLIEGSAEFKFLFKYVFPLPRMLSLLTIYNSESVLKNSDEVAGAFDGTKGALRNLFYTLDVDEGDLATSWWQEESKLEEEGKDARHELERQEAGLSPFSAPGLTAMAMRTVPLFVRGYAEYSDPHYKFVSRLSDQGVLPTGKTWASVPLLWPVNWSIGGIPGWGPPLGPWGIAAYSMPQLPGDRKQQNITKQEQAAEVEMFKQAYTDKELDCDEEEN